MRRYAGLKIYLFYGLKGSGKSLYQAYIATRLFKEYARLEKKYPDLPKRTYWSSQKLSAEIEEKELGRHLFYWENPKQLYDVRNADIGWDEIGKDLPAGDWANTPKKLKQVFSHLRKRGNRLFANTQVYEDIDISFRRQIDRAYRLEKICGSKDVSATLPAPKKIWGLIRIQEFDPMLLEHEKNERKRLSLDDLPRFLLIRKKYINAYDTTMEIPPYMPDALEHFEYACPTCGKVHIDHKKM